jgi:hypothetical protein
LVIPRRLETSQIMAVAEQATARVLIPFYSRTGGVEALAVAEGARGRSRGAPAPGRRGR